MQINPFLADCPSIGLTTYIAAPFAALATPVDGVCAETRERPGNGKSTRRQHGVIYNGRYRATLEQLAEILEGSGSRVVLPHRDVNDWGASEMTPADVGEQCLELVERSDLFVGILGQSYGAHVEAGVALALRKPMILFALSSDMDVFAETFMGRAIRESRQTVGCRVRVLEDIVEIAKSDRFESLVCTAIGLVHDAAPLAATDSRWVQP